MFALDRIISFPRVARTGRSRAGAWPPVCRGWASQIKLFRAPVLLFGGVALAAACGWTLAGGSLPAVAWLSTQTNQAGADGSVGGAPVHVDSAPSDAEVLIDGRRIGHTPVSVSLSPGQHTLSLRDPEALDVDQALAVADTGASVSITLWRRRPDVLPLRPVYPGACLVDARFLNDGQVVMVANVPGQMGGRNPTNGRELWRLDPSTGQLTHVALPGVDVPSSVLTVAPNGQQVAYVTPGSSPTLSASLWPVSSAPAGARENG